MEDKFYTKLLTVAAFSFIFISGVYASHGEFKDGADPSLGDEGAKITMVVWCDFQGPFCEQFNSEVLPEIEDEYVEEGDVKIVWKDLPLPQIGHEWAEPAAAAMECSYREGGDEAFWEILDRVYQNQDSLTQENVQSQIIDYSEDYEITEEEMESCISDSSVEEEVESDREIAENHDISGTPTTLINGEELVGAKPYSEFESIIESKLGEDSESGEDEEESPEAYRSDPVLGDEDAEVTMVVYEDFQCPFCQQFEQNAMPQIKSNYVDSGQVKVVWKDSPLPQLGHDWAEPAAAAMECVYREGGNDAFWEVKDRIFNNQDSLNTDNIQERIQDWAEDEGVSEESVDSCLAEENPMDEVEADSKEGRENGASGTPTMFIDGKKIVGAQPYSRFEEVIEAKLNGERLPNEEREDTEGEENNGDAQELDTDASELQERLNKSQKNITALEKRLEEQQQEIEQLEEQQNTIVSILDSIMNILGI